MLISSQSGTPKRYPPVGGESSELHPASPRSPRVASAHTRTYLESMRHIAPLCALMAIACGEPNPENTATCGFAILGAANKALEQLHSGNRLLSDAPADFRGMIPARVPGHGTVAALVGETDQGPIVAYDGDGFPPVSGYGVIMVNDSTDATEGVLIYDLDPPMGYPILGGVSNGRYVIPLFGMRVAWSAVSTDRCPLFAKIDSTAS